MYLLSFVWFWRSARTYLQTIYIHVNLAITFKEKAEIYCINEMNEL